MVRVIRDTSPNVLKGSGDDGNAAKNPLHRG